MFCHKCGGPLVNGALFCSYCGAGTPRGNFQDQARGQRKQPALVHRPDHRLYQNPNLLQRQGHYKPNLQQQQGPQLYHQPPLELQQTRPVYQTTHYIAKQETLTTSTTVDKLPRKPAPKQPQPRSYTQKQQTSGQAKNKALRKPQEASSEKRT
ncbi:nuclear transcription factor Y subunit beta-like isoform X2 [Dreissena polymorpha]|uniref:nuclear transcription factor Y subunit beta-like isoform X2 n=1 Tax=Dreissena polymorpha TaxID=45954 RepID=UPI002264713C|nr:nuclear transcription factor Y subunit beta-like isoform X2 [Dreissena polymorpha]